MMSGVLLLLLRRGLGLVPWVFILMMIKMMMMGALVSVSGCPPHAQKQLAQCLKPVLPFLKQSDIQPSYHTCSTIKTFIRCVGKKKRECGESMRRRNVFKIANDLKVKFCDPAALATTLPTPTTTTTPPPNVYEQFDRCRQQFKSSSHRSLRQACRAANTFVECGQSVLWSHDFCLETFQLHAELMRNRAVFWQHCRRRSLLRGGVGRGLCPYDVTAKLASCLNITYWQPVAPGDAKTFCGVAVEIVPCLGELANGCHQVAALQAIADFMWTTFQLLSSQCSRLKAKAASVLYEYGDYDDGGMRNTPPQVVHEPVKASKASYQKPATPSAPRHPTAKPASKHGPRLDVDQIDNSEEAPDRDGQSGIKPKPDSVVAEEKVKVVRPPKMDMSAQKAEEGASEDSDGMSVLQPSSDVQDPTTSLPEKAAGKPDSEEPDCIDQDGNVSAGPVGKEGGRNGHGGVLNKCNSSNSQQQHNQTKQADVDSEAVPPPSKKPPQDKSPEKEQASSAEEQPQTSSPQHSTLPADPKLSLPTLPGESTSERLTTARAGLLTPGTPASSPEKETRPDNDDDEVRSSPRTPAQSTPMPSFPVTSPDAVRATGGHADREPAEDLSAQSDPLIESKHEGKGGREKEELENELLGVKTTVVSLPENIEGKEELENELLGVKTTVVSLSENVEGKEELENELLGVKTTTALHVHNQTPTPVPISDSSLPTTSANEQENQLATTVSSQTEKEKQVADAHKVTPQSSSTSINESPTSTHVRPSMAISDPETTTANVAFQASAGNQTLQESQVSDSEEKEQIVKPAELENRNFSEMLTTSPLSAESNQNSNRTTVQENEEGESILPSTVSQNAHSYEISKEVGQSTSHTPPTANQFSSEPSTLSTAESLESTTLRQDSVSTESDDHEEKPSKELTPTESPTNDSSEPEQRQEKDWGGADHNASDFSSSEAGPLFDMKKNESGSFEALNLTRPEKNDSVTPRKSSVKPQEIAQKSVDEGRDLSEGKKDKNKSTTLLSVMGSTTTDTAPATTTVPDKETSPRVKEGDQSASKMEPGDIKHLIHVIQSTTLKPTAGENLQVQKRPEEEAEEEEEEQSPPKTTPAVSEPENEENGSKQKGQAQEIRGPWGSGCSQPWQGHTFCTNIIMRASLANSYWKVCRGLQLYLQCLNQLLEACPGFQPFGTIGDTVDFVTRVFQHKCPEF